MPIRVLILLAVISALAMSSCAPTDLPSVAPILLFNGTGASPNDVKEFEAILNSHSLAYTTVDSKRLNDMSVEQLSKHKLLLVPGGNYIHMGDSLSPAAAANVRVAVTGGLNYLGVCAGGILAGNGEHNHFNLTDGVKFDFYAVVNQGVHKTTAAIATADGRTLEQYWEDGPQFTGWGDVVGKYPDGTPAVVQGTVGKGWVVLCGVHPEAPENWRKGMQFGTPAREDHAYAAELMDAALNGRPLPKF